MNITNIFFRRRNQPTIPVAQKVENLAVNMELFDKGKLAPEDDALLANPPPAQKESGKVITSDAFAECIKNGRNNRHFRRLRAKARYAEADESIKNFGEKIRIEDAVGRPAIFYGFRIAPSILEKSKGESFITILLEFEDEQKRGLFGGARPRHFIYSGSTILIQESIKMERDFPFHGMIVKKSKTGDQANRHYYMYKKTGRE